MLALPRGKKSLQTFIIEAMSDEELGVIHHITLVHMTGQTPKELYTVTFGKGRDYKADKLEELFLGKADGYCQELPGAQTFQLLAFFKKKLEDGTESISQTPGAYQPFIRRGQSNYDGLETEGPDDKGQRAQMMRQQEAVFNVMMRRQATLDEATTSLIVQQGQMLRVALDHNQALQADYLGAVRFVAESIAEKADKSQEHAMQQLEHKRKTEERAKWLALAPPLINTILGREVFPQSTIDTQIVDAVAQNISEDDMLILANKLPQEVLGLVYDRFTKSLEKRAEEKKAKQLAAQSGQNHPNPEANAAGEA